MADMSDNKWNEQDNLNTSPAPDGLPPGSPPSAVYGVIRNGRGAQKRDFNRSNSILTSSGTGDAYVLTYDVGPSAFVKGEIFRFFPHADNTGPATIKINGLATKAMVQSSGAPLIAEQIRAGQSIEISYDGTAYRMLSNVTNNPVFSGQVYVGPTGSVMYSDGNIKFSNNMVPGYGDYLSTALDARLLKSGGTMTGTLGLPSFNESSFKQGPSDGASYTSHNLIMKGWWGLGMQDYTNTVNAYYDFRAGKWDTKGGMYKNGVEYVLPDGKNYAINITGQAGWLRAGATGTAMKFNWNGQAGQPSWLWGGNDGAEMYVYNPSNFTVANSAQLGGFAASEYTRGKVGTKVVPSGTSITYPDIPAGVAKFTIHMRNVVFSAGAQPFIKVGSAAGVVSAGYSGSLGTIAGAAGFSSGSFSNAINCLFSPGNANSIQGSITFTRVPGTFDWVFSGQTIIPGEYVYSNTIQGGISLGAELDRFQLSTLAGTATMSGTAIWADWEF